MNNEYIDYLEMTYDLSRGELKRSRKPHFCISTGCTEKPVDGTFCAKHSPFLNERNSKEFKRAVETYERWKTAKKL